MTIHRYGLISDTHGHLHPDVFPLFDGVETILHAGDVVDEGILDELEAIAPVFAVQGNCDPMTARLPLFHELDLAPGRAILTHSHIIDGGVGPPSRLAEHFAFREPRLIVFGHTHQHHVERCDGMWLANPGPACKPRFRDEPSVVILNWESETDGWDFKRKRLDWRRVKGRR